jgi:hypothetical protein
MSNIIYQLASMKFKVSNIRIRFVESRKLFSLSDLCLSYSNSKFLDIYGRKEYLYEKVFDFCENCILRLTKLKLIFNKKKFTLTLENKKN